MGRVRFKGSGPCKHEARPIVVHVCDITTPRKNYVVLWLRDTACARSAVYLILWCVDDGRPRLFTRMPEDLKDAVELVVLGAWE